MPLHSHYLPEPGAPASARRDLGKWLAALGWPAEPSEDLLLAVSEAVTNAAEHAYRGGDRSGLIELCVTDLAGPDGAHRAIATVIDRGTWRIPPSAPGYRGRGLRLIRALTESVEMTGGAAGTQVKMISRPVLLDTEFGVESGSAARADVRRVGALS
ncbi:MAG TPA: ATP-binding protein [Pseudonocardia sp.]